MTTTRYRVKPNSNAGLFKNGGDFGIHLARSAEDAVALVREHVGADFDKLAPDGIHAELIDEAQEASRKGHNIAQAIKMLYNALELPPVIVTSITMSLIQEELIYTLRGTGGSPEDGANKLSAEIKSMLNATAKGYERMQSMDGLGRLFKALGIDMADVASVEPLEVFRDKDLPEPGAADPKSPWNPKTEVSDEVSGNAQEGST